MLKDYYNPNLHSSEHALIREFLDGVSSLSVFVSYGQARSYRVIRDCKDDNGRYHLSIVLYDGCYYVMTKEQAHRLKSFVKCCSKPKK